MERRGAQIYEKYASDSPKKGFLFRVFIANSIVRQARTRKKENEIWSGPK